MLNNILFDLDGTLTDAKAGITRSIRFAMEQLGVEAPPEQDLTWCIGPSLREAFADLLHTKDEGVIENALAIYRGRFTTIGMYENDVYPGVVPSLNRIKAAGLAVFLSTAKPRVFAEKILDHFDLTPLFDGVYGSELDGRLSDKGDLIAHILAKENLEPRQTLMVGDRSQDIIGGRKNGTLTAAVGYGYGSPQEIAASNPDYTFDTIQALAAFVEIERTRS